MYFFIKIENDYINAIGMGPKPDGYLISQEEYDELCSLLNKPPIAPVGKIYKLRLDKTWELIEA